jgi:hypothetical protein
LYQGGSGGVSGHGILYPAMMAIALTEILETLGYSVSFISGWDASQRLEPKPSTGEGRATGEAQAFQTNENIVTRGIYNPRKRAWVRGERYVMFSIKKFEENLNLPELLYLTADPSLYRWQAWRNMFLTFDEHNDKFPDVGYLGDRYNWREAVYSSFMPIDVNKGVIYITILDIDSIASVKEQIREIINYAEELNRSKREELGIV